MLPPQFGIRHWMSAAPIQYSIKEFCCHNMDLEASPDLYALLSGTSRSRFVRRLFGIDQIALDYYPEEKSTIVGCFLSMCPASRPTVRHPLAELNINSNNADENDPLSHVAPLPLAVEPLQLPAELPSVDATDPANMFIGEISGALDDVFAAANSCKVWHMLHVRALPAHAGQQSSIIDSVFVQQQVHALGLSDMELCRTCYDLIPSPRQDRRHRACNQSEPTDVYKDHRSRHHRYLEPSQSHSERYPDTKQAYYKGQRLETIHSPQTLDGYINRGLARPKIS
ncbi:hypothetical protein LPJ73_000516 [Coemansia sp. RSA 2703]|nr:hypothetical protein LPJ73_000516 [Coemansia sp. RSA 2703]